jgi:hypothetical protein
MSTSSPIGASTRAATLTVTLPRFQATLSAREMMRWIWTIVLGLRGSHGPVRIGVGHASGGLDLA